MIATRIQECVSAMVAISWNQFNEIVQCCPNITKVCSKIETKKRNNNGRAIVEQTRIESLLTGGSP